MVTKINNLLHFFFLKFTEGGGKSQVFIQHTQKYGDYMR